eukprot:TRINITY_DN3487_c0_g1_i1.p1 TRINITY_DN3487_c0_g1~~TRINITY_DN3487_c0_g1_i1.p1  ORF type:complete len:764 (+),score=127.68 TRINITY_DN3487_c0_g1_i1:19-2310(+)
MPKQLNIASMFRMQAKKKDIKEPPPKEKVKEQPTDDRPVKRQRSSSAEKEKEAKPATVAPKADPKVETTPAPKEKKQEEEYFVLNKQYPGPKPDYLAVEKIEDEKLPVALTHSKLILDVEPQKKTWEGNAEVPYMYLCDALVEISAIGSRLEVSTLMTKCFYGILAYSPTSMLNTVYLALNQLAPEVEGVELGIGDAFLMKCIAAGTGLSIQRVREKYKTLGDLAELAQNSKINQTYLVQPKRLTINGVYTMLRQVAAMSGKDVQKRRTDIICKALRSAKPVEANFIIRSLQGKMRLGLALNTIMMALAHAFLLHETPKDKLKKMGPAKLQWLLNSTSDRMKQSFNEMPSFDILVPALLSDGLRALQRVTLRLNLPVKPMLAKPMKDVKLVLKRFTDGDFICEYKYDGERAQIHYSKNVDTGAVKIEIFSRNSEHHTTKYPDVIKMLNDTNVIKESTTSFIIDSEIVAYDVEEQKILPFQVLQGRARKDVAIENVKVKVCVYAFDILYLNGEVLLHKTLKERKQHLYSAITEKEGDFLFATSRECSDQETIETFLADSIKHSCEGLMVKTLVKNSQYTPSRRTFNWLKLKKDYLDGVGDSVDLVPIAAWHGKGKRTGTYSAYLLACFEPDTGMFQAVCKVGTGFKDEDLVTLTEKLVDHEIPKPNSNYTQFSAGGDAPDVWLDSVTVWEVKAADLSISPKYPAAAGLIDSTKGIALRFPRFIRVRDDKNTTDATSCHQIADLYRQQFANEETDAKVEDSDDDY